MKLLIIQKESLSSQNGASTNRKLSLLNGLQKLGITVREFVETEKDTNEITNPSSLEMLYRRISLLGSLMRSYFGLYPHINRLIKLIEKEKPDVIWVNPEYAAFNAILKHREQFDGVLFYEISEFLDIHRAQKTNWFRKKLLDRNMFFLETKGLNSLNGLALMTKTLYDYCENSLRLKIPLLHLPMTVDLTRFQNVGVQPPKDFIAPYIAFVGVMNNLKDGVDILIQAFSQINIEFPSHRLYLIGPWQPDTPGHLGLIKKLGLESKVKWMKTYPREDIPGIIMKASLLVLPRPDSKQAQGGFPTKLGEYLATGKPVCATTVGEIPDYLSDNESVYFAEPGSVDSFADAMRRALGNPVKASKIGENGKRVAEKEFNASTQAKKLKTFFEQLIERKHDKR